MLTGSVGSAGSSSAAIAEYARITLYVSARPEFLELKDAHARAGQAALRVPLGGGVGRHFEDFAARPLCGSPRLDSYGFLSVDIGAATARYRLAKAKWPLSPARRVKFPSKAELLEDAVSAAEGVVEEVRVTAADADAGDVAVDTTDTDAVKAADRLWGADAV